MKSDYSNLNMKKFHRNITVARTILLFSFILLLILFYEEKKAGENSYLTFLAFIIEAVLIASIADGVAIFALTRRVKIGKWTLKFTGLIQNKREALINGIVEAFRKKFFPREKLIETLQEIKVVDGLKKIIEENLNEENSEIIGKSISKLMRKNKEKITDIILNELEKYIIGVNSAEFVEKIYQLSRKYNIAHEIIEVIFDKLYNYAESKEFRVIIKEKMEESEKNSKKGFWSLLKYGAAKVTNILNYEELAAAIQTSILLMLKNIRDEENGVKWKNVEGEFSELIKRVSKNREFLEEAEKIKAEVIINMLRPFILKSISMIALWIEDGKIEKKEVEELLSKYGVNINVDFETINIVVFLNSAMKRGVEELAKSDKVVQENYEKLIARIIENEYGELTVIIKEVLSKLTDDGIVNKINEVVGSNIQWLRISGAYVGAVTGAVIFAVIKYPVVFLPVFSGIVLLLLMSKSLRKKLIIYSE